MMVSFPQKLSFASFLIFPVLKNFLHNHNEMVSLMCSCNMITSFSFLVFVLCFAEVILPVYDFYLYNTFILAVCHSLKAIPVFIVRHQLSDFRTRKRIYPA